MQNNNGKNNKPNHGDEDMESLEECTTQMTNNQFNETRGYALYVESQDTCLEIVNKGKINPSETNQSN